MARHRPLRPIQLLLLVLWSSSQLYARPAAAELSPSERETARALMAEGDRLLASGELRGAMNRYQAAHAIVHAPTTGLDLARVQAQLGLLVEARSTASEVIHHPVVANEPHVFAAARKDAIALANELEARVPAVRAEVKPSDAAHTISVDGVTLPAAIGSLPYKVNPGQHSLRVDADGYLPVTRQVTVDDGETQVVAFELTPQTIVPNGASSSLSSGSQPMAASADQIDSDVERRREAGQLRGVIGLGVGGASFVAGTITGIMALSMGSDLKRNCRSNTCPPEEHGALSTTGTLANVSNITLPIGVIGIAYGLYELLTLPSAQPSAERASALQLEFTGTGAMLRGSL